MPAVTSAETANVIWINIEFPFVDGNNADLNLHSIKLVNLGERLSVFCLVLQNFALDKIKKDPGACLSEIKGGRLRWCLNMKRKLSMD